MGVKLARSIEFPLGILNGLHIGNVEGVLIINDDVEELSSSGVFSIGNS